MAETPSGAQVPANSAAFRVVAAIKLQISQKRTI
jgi:hypothetical protein